MTLSHSKGTIGLNVSRSNSTDEYYDKLKVDISSVLAAYLLILAACLIGNALVCITIMKNKEMRMKRWYRFLINLSIADIGFALLTPIHLIQTAHVNIGMFQLNFQFNYFPY